MKKITNIIKRVVFTVSIISLPLCFVLCGAYNSGWAFAGFWVSIFLSSYLFCDLVFTDFK